MRTIKGTYENGVVTLKEPAPLKDKQEVTILIPEEGEGTILQALRYAGMLSDLSAEEKAAFDEALKRDINFERQMHP